MTNRELLELAAKAAGMNVRESRFHPNELVFEIEQGSWDRWNPLTDDGDALRLAVKLGMDINIESVLGRTRVNDIYEDYGSDPTAAIRRAIVRAAAENDGTPFSLGAAIDAAMQGGRK